MSDCATCGYVHPSRPDREACEAMHGRVRRYHEDGPEVMCAPCGYVAPYASLLEHFITVHYNEDVGTGRLVRTIRTLGGV